MASVVFLFTQYRHIEKSVQEPRVVVPEVPLLLEGDCHCLSGSVINVIFLKQNLMYHYYKQQMTVLSQA